MVFEQAVGGWLVSEGGTAVEPLDKAGRIVVASWGANIGTAAATAVFLYVIVAVLQQSDAELILPNSVFDLGGFLDRVKDGIPGGAFVAPVLQIKLPLTLFYTGGPVALVVLHAVLVVNRTALPGAAPIMRALAIWSPLAALASIRWRFAPYVSARPEPPPVGEAMERLQTIAMLLDLVLVLVAVLRGADDGSESWRRVVVTRIIPARALRHAAAIWLIAVLGLGAWPWWSFAPNDLEGMIRLAAPAVLFVGWVIEARRYGGQPRGIRQRIPSSFVLREDLTMFGRVCILAVSMVLLALPGFGRTLDLSKQMLVGREPADTLVDKLLDGSDWESDRDGSGSDRRRTWRLDTADRIADARFVAWMTDGAGISLPKWHFPGGRFDRATMALITLSGADLEMASLNSANLQSATLTDAYVRGANFSHASLMGALARDLRQVRTPLVQLAAAAESTLGNPDTGAAPKLRPDATKDDPDPCAHWPKEAQLDFSYANISGTDFSGADLRCADLTYSSNMTDTVFANTHMEGARIGGAGIVISPHLKDALLDFITIEPGTVFAKGTDITGADFRHAMLDGVDFSNVIGMGQAHFDFAHLACAIFPENIGGATFKNADYSAIAIRRKDGQKSAPINLAKTAFVEAVQDVGKLSSSAAYDKEGKRCKDFTPRKS